MKILLKYSRYIIVLGGITTTLGAIAQLININYSQYIFAFGAVVLIFYQFMIAINDKNEDFRVHRLSRLSFIASLFLGLAAYFMFIHSNAWVVAVLIFALITLFLTFRTK